MSKMRPQREPELFKFIETQDGSLTVRVTDPVTGTDSESMHSLRGAYSETVYIYGAAIESCFQQKFPPRILSLGLGLGYVEILSAALALKYGIEIEGESFEILPELRDWFFGWTQGQGDVPADFVRVYDDALTRSAATAEVDAAAARESLRRLFREDRWILREELTAATTLSRPFGCLCFDAFSSKTSPDLWTEEFLDSFLKRSTSPQAVLATYACTGALKRSLRKAGFTLEIREGFASKRDSTFAVRTQ